MSSEESTLQEMEHMPKKLDSNSRNEFVEFIVDLTIDR